MMLGEKTAISFNKAAKYMIGDILHFGRYLPTYIMYQVHIRLYLPNGYYALA